MVWGTVITMVRGLQSFSSFVEHCLLRETIAEANNDSVAYRANVQVVVSLSKAQQPMD